jgi:hypothetical protein
LAEYILAAGRQYRMGPRFETWNFKYHAGKKGPRT